MIVNSEIKVKSKDEITTLFTSNFKEGFEIKDVDRPDDWKNNDTTIVVKAYDCEGIVEAIEKIKVQILAKSSEQIFSSEGHYYFIRFKL